MELKNIKMDAESKSYKSWRKSIDKDGIHKSVSVEEAENGFVIRLCKYGDEDGKYMNDEKVYISTKNPLEDADEVNEEIDAKDEILKSMEQWGL